jgi:hypothetical protein
MGFRMSRLIGVAVVAACVIGCASSPVGGGPREAAASGRVASPNCRPAPDASLPQHVLGYGSLMQDASRQRTTPRAGPAQPVEVSGYRRGWFLHGPSVGFSTTYLGAVAAPEGSFNAVVYAVDVEELAATDRREGSYCRALVATNALRVLGSAPRRVDGQVWIYINDPATIAAPTPRFPIVQSYVDIFVSGCMEQEERFALPSFAARCIATTQGWSDHWVNDRPQPRRPFIAQPRALQIDTLLAREVPEAFAHIRIE